MSNEEIKFALYRKLQALGFSYAEAKALRRIEIVLRRWSADVASGRIYRTTTGTAIHKHFTRDELLRPIERHHPIADREAAALRRCAWIIAGRNERQCALEDAHPCKVFAYHRPHPTECNLFLITRAQLGDADISTAVERGLAVTA